MGDWLEGFRERIEGIKRRLWVIPKSWTIGWLKPEQVPDKFQGRTLTPRKDYVEIRLKSMRIPFARQIGRKYYGAVHSFISLPSLVSGRAAFNVVTTPTLLQKVDPANLSNVIQSDILLLGPTPYQGGDIMVEAGVFSVLEQDLIAPFLKVIEDISKTAGVGVISQAMPFVQPLENAIYQLIGASDSNKLEIGIKKPVKGEGYLVVVGARPTDDYLSTLELKEDGRLFTKKEEITKPYMVLTIRARKNRDEYVEIPDVLKALQNLLAAISTAKTKESILEFYNSFTRVTLSSPDLLPEDATLINKQVYEERVIPALDRVQATEEKRRIAPEIDVEEAKKFLGEITRTIKSRGASS